VHVHRQPLDLTACLEYKTPARRRHMFSRLIAWTVKAPLKRLGYGFWVLNGRFGRRLSFGLPQKATILLPAYSPERLHNVEPMVRTVLRCDFVSRVIVSNHNPDIRIEDHVRLRDERLSCVNQPIRRGCGYGWIVASGFDPEFLICIDDDLRLLPSQVARLFARLLGEPAIPHGLAGIRASQYYQNRDMEVDELNQVYAITRAHLRTYRELVAEITDQGLVTDDAVEFWGDDIVISQSGAGRPKIHATGFILRCPTANHPRVATYKQSPFPQSRAAVYAALAKVRSTRSDGLRVGSTSPNPGR
jgi:hypothetical protein